MSSEANPSTNRDTGEINVEILGTPARRDKTAVREHNEALAFKKIDGRTLRRKGRTELISYRISPKTRETMQRIAEAEGIMLVEVIEKGVELYDQLLTGKRADK
jgi:hypothetical protein